MRQIAERAGVSIGTVSHVINETATVRPKLRERVIEAIRSMGYQPSALAQGLRKNRTNMLGMVIPDITNPFFPGVVRGVEDELGLPDGERGLSGVLFDLGVSSPQLGP